MSYSVFDSSIDSVAQWIDTSLITDPAFLSLFDLYSSQSSNGLEFTSSSTLAEGASAVTANQALTNDFGLANGLSNECALADLARKSSIARSDTASESFSPLEPASRVRETPVLDELTKLKKERRRAQNRKAQQAFRKRKDTAIARLEKEMEKLKSINLELSQTNRARLQEISELKARLGALRLAPLSPYNECRDVEEDNKAELSSPLCVQPPLGDDRATVNKVPWIKWRGRLYVDNEALATSVTENRWSPFVGSSPSPAQKSAEEF